MRVTSYIWFERPKRKGYGVFEKILVRWFKRRKGWYTIHDLKARIPELKNDVAPNIRTHLMQLVEKGFLERRPVQPTRPNVPNEHQYRRRPL